MHQVSISNSLYVSCCYYGLKEAGLIKSKSTPKYYEFGQKISELGKDFSFKAPMAGGPIFSLVYQIPGYLNAKPHDLNNIFNGIKTYVENKSIDYFVREWPNETRFWDLWYTESWNNYLHKQFSFNKNRVLKVVEDFFCYITDIWAEYQSIHSKKLQDYPFANAKEICNKYNAFNKWNEELKLSYPYDNFTIIICPETNSSASSLGPEKIVVGAKYNIQELINSCMHEIGVRMFGLHRLEQNPATREIFLKDYHGLIILIENEVCYRKPHVLPEIGKDPFIKGMNLTELHHWRANQEIMGDIFNSFSIWYKQLKENGLL